MKLSDHILRKPFYVAFGQPLQGSGITSVDLVATRDATAVTMTASDGSAAPIAGADASTAGVMTAIDKSKLDSLPTATARDLATKLDVATSTIGVGITHVRTAGNSAAGDGGAAFYKRVGSAPSHALKVQSADGAWWEIVPTNNIISFIACGGIEGNNAVNGAANVTAFNDFIGYAQSLSVTPPDIGIGTLQFPRGDYHFSTHLNVKAGVHIQGVGPSHQSARGGSVLHFPMGSHGFIIQNHNTVDAITEPSSFSGFGSIIEGLWLTGGGNAGVSGNGFWLRTLATVRDCVVTAFGADGVQVSADESAGGALEGNASSCVLHNVLVTDCGRHGFYMEGADANTGLASNCQAQICGRWGFYDSSLLGNTYIACNSATNGVASIGGNAADQSSYVSDGADHYSANVNATEAQLAATQPGTDGNVWIPRGVATGLGAGIPLWVPGKPVGTYFHGGSYHTDGPGASSTFTGCYREDDHGECQVQGPAMMMGGEFHSNKANGLAMIGLQTGAKVSGQITFPNSETFPNVATRQLDLIANIDHEKLLRAQAGPFDWINVVAWDEGSDTYVIGEFANSPDNRAMLIAGQTTGTLFDNGRASGYVGGDLIFGHGFFIGEQPWLARHMGNGIAAPTAGEHGRGEIVWNRDASSAAALGWVCTVSGVPGTWVEIRGAGTQTSGANQTALTNATGGVRDGTLSAVGDTSTTDQSAAINGNIAELHTLLDEVRTTLVNFGLMKGGV